MPVKFRKGRYEIEFQQDGVRVHRRLPKVATKAHAQALETKIRRELFNENRLGRGPAFNLGAAIEKWLESTLPHRKDKTVTDKANHWRPFVADKTLLEDSPSLASRATSEWTANGLTPATINRRLCVLKATLKHAYKQGWIAENLSGRITLLKEENMREVYLSPAQVSKFVESSPTAACATAIMVAAYSGLRASEILAQKQVPTHADMLTVPTSKNGKPRLVPIAKQLRPYLSALPLGISYRTLNEHFCIARKAAGMEHVRFHDLRHTCASMLINRGVDLYTVGRILGNPSAVQRYAHLANSTLKRAMRKIG